MAGLDPYDSIRRPPLPEPAAPAPLTVTMPPPPDVSITEHGASSSTTSTKFDDRFHEGAAAEQAGVDTQIQARQDLKGIAENQGIENERALDEQAKRAQADADEAARVAADEKKKVDDRIAEYDRRVVESDKAAKPTTFFQDKGTLGTLFSHVVVGLSERSHRLAGGKGGESPLQKELTRQIDEDTKRKALAYEASKGAVEAAKQGIDIARTAKADYQADVKTRQAAGIDVLIKKTKAYAAKLGTQEALAKADEAIGVLEEQKGKLHADRYQLAKTVTQSDSGKTVTTTNIPNDGGDARKPASVTDAEKRAALQESERANLEIAEIAKKHPQAIAQLQAAEREFASRETIGKIPAAGAVVNTALSLVNGPTKDAWLKDASPEARRANELIETLATARAKALGGAVTDGDRAAIKAQLGILGKNASEISASAREYAGQSAKQRESIESVARFPGAAKSPAETSAQKEHALSRLIALTGKRGAGKTAVEEAAKAAKAAGWPTAVVDGLTRKAVK